MLKSIRTIRISNDLIILLLLALTRLALHALTNDQYGFHRDELAVLDDARRLAWGYVAYPPLTPFIGRIALELFGPSLVGLRFFAALAQSIGMVLAGLMARELGGGRWAVVVAALATAIAPMSLIMGALFQYIAFDYLWWVLAAYLIIRLLKSDDPRWWLPIGLTLGLGMLTKYTIAFYIAGIVAGILLTPARRHLKSPWLWAGAALSFLVFLPNLLWHIQNEFISLEFLSHIHARDIEIGRTDGFLTQQLFVSANPFTLPLWLAGLYYYFRVPAASRFRPLGWMFAVTLLLMALAQSRFYYLAPAYPMLLAGGSVLVEQWLAARQARAAQLGRGLAWGLLAVGAVVGSALMLPIAPINSGWWTAVSDIHDNFAEQIGWPELVETAAGIYTSLPAAEQAQTAILTGNYGEAGAINLYGPDYGLPEAISGVNSYWQHGYGSPPPQTVIVLGFTRERAELFFATCETAGQVTNRYNVQNEETRFHPDIFLCRQPRQPWPLLWPNLRSFN